MNTTMRAALAIIRQYDKSGEPYTTADADAIRAAAGEIIDRLGRTGAAPTVDERAVLDENRRIREELAGLQCFFFCVGGADLTAEEFLKMP